MKVISFYRFLDISDPGLVRDELQVLCDEQGLLGTILVATEGFNGTLAGRYEKIETVLSWLKGRFEIADVKRAYADRSVTLQQQGLVVLVEGDGMQFVGQATSVLDLSPEQEDVE